MCAGPPQAERLAAAPAGEEELQVSPQPPPTPSRNPSVPSRGPSEPTASHALSSLKRRSLQAMAKPASLQEPGVPSSLPKTTKTPANSRESDTHFIAQGSVRLPVTFGVTSAPL